MAKRRHKRTKRTAAGCGKTRITIRRKGKRAAVTFTGRPAGRKACGLPKLRPSTARIAKFRTPFKAAVRACKKASHKRHGKHGKSAFNVCIGKRMRAA